jgi:hypothetical protein
MKPPLLMALALVLGATLWLQQGEGDEADSGVELAERTGARQPADATAGRHNGGRTSPAADRAPAAAASAAQDAGQRLVQAVNAREAWRLQEQVLPPPRAMTSAAPSAWTAVQPPPPPAPRPTRKVDTAPVAPRFPHQWVGRFDDEDAAGRPRVRRAVISGPVSTWVAREGDVIEGQWRVDQIQDRMMRLTFLPLQQSQMVAMK